MKNKIINVNKYCEINKDNIAKSRDREIGINIIQKEKKEKGFINYCLAIGYVYNDHNGYYSHTIYEVENGKIIYEDNL